MSFYNQGFSKTFLQVCVASVRPVSSAGRQAVGTGAVSGGEGRGGERTGGGLG